VCPGISKEAFARVGRLLEKGVAENVGWLVGIGGSASERDRGIGRCSCKESRRSDSGTRSACLQAIYSNRLPSLCSRG
jgi:hypothetical protein